MKFSLSASENQLLHELEGQVKTSFEANYMPGLPKVLSIFGKFFFVRKIGKTVFFFIKIFLSASENQFLDEIEGRLKIHF